MRIAAIGYYLTIDYRPVILVVRCDSLARGTLMNRPIAALLLAAVAVTTPLWAMPTTAHGQIFVTNPQYNASHEITVGEYTTSGATVNASLITAVNGPWGIAASGTNLFVANLSSNTIGEFSATGTTVNSSLITGLNAGPIGVAISGTNLFVAMQDGPGSIGEYTTAGVPVNSALVTGLNSPTAIAVSGGNLFVTSYNGTVAEYTTAGVSVNPALITGLSMPTGIAVSGGNLFVTSFSNGVVGNSGTIGEYTTAGVPVNPALVTGLGGPEAITVYGTNLLVANGASGTIGEYTMSGDVINSALVTGQFSPAGIVVVPELAWQNPTNRLDVNNSGNVSAQDVLLLVNELATKGPYSIAGTARDSNPFFDINGDGNVSALDLLLLVDDLSSNSPTSLALSRAIAVVPEPSSVVLAGLGIVGLLAWGWRRRQH